MNKINIDNFKIGEEVLIMAYNPPAKAVIADMYELPYEQIPKDSNNKQHLNMMNKFRNKKVPIVEVFLNGKVYSFVKYNGNI